MNFPAGSLETFESDGSRNPDGRLILGQTGGMIEARQFLMYVVRPLDHPKDWVVGASYRSQAVTRLYSQVNLGLNGAVLIYDMLHGTSQAIVGAAARHPETDALASPLHEAMKRSPAGVWTGPSTVDGIERIHAYHSVKGRDIAVVVAMSTGQAMAPAVSLAAGTRAVAAVASALVLVAGGVVLWSLYTLRARRRRGRIHDRAQNDLAAAQTDLADARSQMRIAADQVKFLMEASPDGILLTDQDLRVKSYNQCFVDWSGIEPGTIRQGLPLDNLLREQARAGVYGPVADVEQEVARRLVHLRTEQDVEPLRQLGPLGAPVELHWHGTGGGALALILTTPFQPQASKAALSALQSGRADAGGADAAQAATVEW